MTEQDYEQFHHKGGTYILPVEVFNELFEEMENWRNDAKQLKEELDKYKRLVEYLKSLDFYEFELDYDYEENPVSNYYPADMEYHINNFLEIEEIDAEEEDAN